MARPRQTFEPVTMGHIRGHGCPMTGTRGMGGAHSLSHEQVRLAAQRVNEIN